MLLSCILGTLLGASAQGTSTSYPPGWNGEAARPVLGWRSWNAFGAAINDATIRKAIDAITAKQWILGTENVSLFDVGYTRVGIDEGWENCSGADADHGQRQHDSAGFPLIDSGKFPDMKALVDYGHSRGVKMGWYLNGCACGERVERLANYVGVRTPLRIWNQTLGKRLVPAANVVQPHRHRMCSDCTSLGLMQSSSMAAGQQRI